MKNYYSVQKKINAQFEELKRLKGENFNVFRIFNMESSETKLHSTFIAELLSPNGSQGMGDRFFKKFYRLLQLELDLPPVPALLDSNIQNTSHGEETIKTPQERQNSFKPQMV